MAFPYCMEGIAAPDGWTQRDLIQQDFVPGIVLVTMVPRCQTLQKSFLDTLPVIAVNH